MRRPPITAVISDFGGVLTTPLLGSFAAFQDQTGISGEALGRALQALAERDGAHPLYELETGRMTEVDFLELEVQLSGPNSPQIEQLVDESAESPVFPLNHIERRSRGRGRQRAAYEALRSKVNRCERSPDLVRGDRQKLVAAGDRLSRPFIQSRIVDR